MATGGAQGGEHLLHLGRIVQLTAHDAREVESILAVLHAAGCDPEDLEIGRADLEDVFLEIMQAEMPQRVPAVKVAH